MAFSAYPTVAALSDFLSGKAVASVALTLAVRAGIEAFEGKVQRHMLAGVTTDNVAVGAETRVFDPPAVQAAAVGRGYLDLGPYGDLARLDSVVYQPANSAPTTWVSGQQYRPLQPNAPARGRPYEFIELLSRWWVPSAISQWGAVAVTGLWGYALKIPNDAFQAMLAEAALALAFPVAVPLGIKSWTGPGGVSQTFDSSYRKDWQEVSAAAVSRYARWSI